MKKIVCLYIINKLPAYKRIGQKRKKELEILKRTVYILIALALFIYTLIITVTQWKQ